MVAFLPPAGKEADVNWVCLEETSPIQDIRWDVHILQPSPDQDNPQYSEYPEGKFWTNLTICYFYASI